MSLKSRNKGKTGEREAAAEIRRLFNVEARRGVQYSGGTDSPDIVCDDMPGVHFEVKRKEQQRFYEWMEQAIGDAGQNVPVVLHRQNNRDWLAVVRLDDLPRLATQVYLTLARDGGRTELPPTAV